MHINLRIREGKEKQSLALDIIENLIGC